MTLAGKYGLGRQGETPPRWQPSFAYDLGDLVQPIAEQATIIAASSAARAGPHRRACSRTSPQTIESRRRIRPSAGGQRHLAPRSPTEPPCGRASASPKTRSCRAPRAASRPCPRGPPARPSTWANSAIRACRRRRTFACGARAAATGSSEPAWPASDPLTITAPLLGSPGGTSVVDGGATWVVIDRRLILPSGAGVLLGDGSQLFGPIP